MKKICGNPECPERHSNKRYCSQECKYRGQSLAALNRRQQRREILSKPEPFTSGIAKQMLREVVEFQETHFVK